MPAIEVITVTGAASLDTVTAAGPHFALSGIPVCPAPGPGEQIAAIVKDTEGRILGYVTQAEVDRIRALPDPVDVVAGFRRIMAGVDTAVGPPEVIVHAYGAAGITACGLETGGAISRHDGYTGPHRSVTSGARDVTCPACPQDGAE